MGGKSRNTMNSKLIKQKSGLSVGPNNHTSSYIGTQPRKAPAMMHLMLMQHYVYGGYYPIGGASEIAFNIIPVIEKSGGKVLVRAKVTKILLNHNERAYGKKRPL